MMRFLGYGIGHKDQIKCVELFNEVDNQVGLEEDTFDLQNMARIEQDAANLLKKAQIARDRAAQALKRAKNSEEVTDSTRDGDDLDAVGSDVEADEECDLDGNL